jgi:hypothetical protein
MRYLSLIPYLPGAFLYALNWSLSHPELRRERNLPFLSWENIKYHAVARLYEAKRVESVYETIDVGNERELYPIPRSQCIRSE